MGWEGISSIVLAISFIFIAIESIATKKSAEYLEHSMKPIAWFIFRSAKTRVERGYVKKDQISKYDTEFIVVNGSKFPILLYFKVSWQKDGISIPADETYWIDNPLHIYPDRMSYTALIDLNKAVRDLGIIENSEGEIRVTIEYFFAARHSSNRKFQGLSETWRFSLKKEVWIVPNGIEDNHIFLSNDGIVQKIYETP